MSARFEVVHSDAGFFARFRASNGRIVWVTESFTRRRAALAAIRTIARVFAGFTPPWLEDGSDWLIIPLDFDPLGSKIAIPVRDVDERAQVRAGVEVAG